MTKFINIQDFATIKCEAKASNDGLKTLHYQANEIIFHYNQQFAFPRNVQAAIDELTKVFVDIRDLKVPDAVNAKKQEIIQKGRTIVKSLKDYKENFSYDASCIGGIESMCKFQLSGFLKHKENLSIEEGVRILQNNQMLREIVNDVERQLRAKPKVEAFLRMQGEIIELLESQLRCYAFAS